MHSYSLASILGSMAFPSLKIMIDEVTATVEYYSLYIVYIDRTNVDGYATSPNFGEIAVFSDRNAQVTS